MGVQPYGTSNGRGGITGGGDLRLPPPEHICKVNYDQYHYGPVSGSSVEDGVKGGQSVVGSGRIGLGGDAEGGSGGGTDGGGGGYGRDRDGLNQWRGYFSKRNIRYGA